MSAQFDLENAVDDLKNLQSELELSKTDSNTPVIIRGGGGKKNRRKKKSGKKTIMNSFDEDSINAEHDSSPPLEQPHLPDPPSSPGLSLVESPQTAGTTAITEAASASASTTTTTISKAINMTTTPGKKQPLLHPQGVDPLTGCAVSGSGGGKVWSSIRASNSIEDNDVGDNDSDCPKVAKSLAEELSAAQSQVNTSKSNKNFNKNQPQVMDKTDHPFFNKYHITPRFSAIFGYGGEGRLGVVNDAYIRRSQEYIAANDPNINGNDICNVFRRGYSFPGTYEENNIKAKTEGPQDKPQQQSSPKTAEEWWRNVQVSEEWREIRIHALRSARHLNVRESLEWRSCGRQDEKSMVGFQTSNMRHKLHSSQRQFGSFKGEACGWEKMHIGSFVGRKKFKATKSRPRPSSAPSSTPSSSPSSIEATENPKFKNSKRRSTNLNRKHVTLRIVGRSSSSCTSTKPKEFTCYVDTKMPMWNIMSAIRRVANIPNLPFKLMGPVLGSLTGTPSGSTRKKLREIKDPALIYDQSVLEVRIESESQKSAKSDIKGDTGVGFSILAREPMEYLRCSSPEDFGMQRFVDADVDVIKKKRKKARKKVRKAVEYDDNGRKVVGGWRGKGKGRKGSVSSVIVVGGSRSNSARSTKGTVGGRSKSPLDGCSNVLIQGKRIKRPLPLPPAPQNSVNMFPPNVPVIRIDL